MSESIQVKFLSVVKGRRFKASELIQWLIDSYDNTENPDLFHRFVNGLVALYPDETALHFMINRILPDGGDIVVANYAGAIDLAMMADDETRAPGYRIAAFATFRTVFLERKTFDDKPVLVERIETVLAPAIRHQTHINTLEYQMCQLGELGNLMMGGNPGMFGYAQRSINQIKDTFIKLYPSEKDHADRLTVKLIRKSPVVMNDNFRITEGVITGEVWNHMAERPGSRFDFQLYTDLTSVPGTADAAEVVTEFVCKKAMELTAEEAIAASREKIRMGSGYERMVYSGADETFAASILAPAKPHAIRPEVETINDQEGLDEAGFRNWVIVNAVDKGEAFYCGIASRVAKEKLKWLNDSEALVTYNVRRERKDAFTVAAFSGAGAEARPFTMMRFVTRVQDGHERLIGVEAPKSTPSVANMVQTGVALKYIELPQWGAGYGVFMVWVSDNLGEGVTMNVHSKLAHLGISTSFFFEATREEHVKFQEGGNWLSATPGSIKVRAVNPDISDSEVYLSIRVAARPTDDPKQLVESIYAINEFTPERTDALKKFHEIHGTRTEPAPETAQVQERPTIFTTGAFAFLNHAMGGLMTLMTDEEQVKVRAFITMIDQMYHHKGVSNETFEVEFEEHKRIWIVALEHDQEVARFHLKLQ